VSIIRKFLLVAAGVLLTLHYSAQDVQTKLAVVGRRGASRRKSTSCAVLPEIKPLECLGLTAAQGATCNAFDGAHPLHLAGFF
jgi:hypothetical protein